MPKGERGLVWAFCNWLWFGCLKVENELKYLRVYAIHIQLMTCAYMVCLCVCGEWDTYVSSFSAIVVSVEVSCGGGVPGPFLVVVLTAQCILCMY